MTSKNIRIITATFFIFISNTLLSNSEYDKYVAKYPDQKIILDENIMNVNIGIKKDKPVVKIDRYKSVFVLSGNASDYSDDKEYFSSHLKIDKFKAYTLIPDGAKYKKKPVKKFKTVSEIDDGLFFDDTYAKSFTYPSVTLGAKLISECSFEFLDFNHSIVYYFAGRVPVDKSRLTVKFPADVKIKYHYAGGKDTSLIQFSKKVSGKEIIYEWTASSTNCYKEDPFSPGDRYFTPHVIVQIASYKAGDQNIDVINSLKDYYKLCYSRIKELNKEPSAEIISLTDSIIKGCGTDRQKVEKLYKWVQTNIKYVAIEDGKNGLFPMEANEVLKKRYGDCKGKSSLLVEMLKAAKIDASLVWLGTRELPYKYSEFPQTQSDNHMIAAWWKDKNNPVILDPTSFYNQIENIPSQIQGKECLIAINDSDYFLYNIPVLTADKNLYADTIAMELKNNVITGKANLLLTGAQAIRSKHYADYLEKDKYFRLIDKSIKASNKFLIDSINVLNDSLNSAVCNLKYTFSLPDYIFENDGNLFINMNIDRFLQNVTLSDNRNKLLPFESEFCTRYKLISSLDIPTGYKLEKLPEGKDYQEEKYGFRQSYQLQNNKLILNFEVNINFLLLNPDEIAGFKTMLAELQNSYKRTIKLTKI